MLSAVVEFYGTTDRESLAVVWAVLISHPHAESQNAIIRTHHDAWKWTPNLRDLPAKCCTEASVYKF